MSRKKLLAREKRERELHKKKKLEHKCGSCVWGSWQGKKHYCMMPKCIK